jgi:two-component system sensor histidine kinase CpxA
VRSFFIQLFLCFWIATFGIMAATLVFFRGWPSDSLPGMREPIQKLMNQAAQLAVEGVAVQGCDFLLKAHSTDITVFNSSYRQVCGSSFDPQLVPHPGDGAGSRWVARGQDNFQTGSMHDANGILWYYVVKIPKDRRPPFFPPLPLTALPSSAIVSLLFAYFLARPVRALSNAIRDFSAGDLSARASVRSVLPGFGGGSDLETLRRDFNSMADRIQHLIEAHQNLIRDVSHELRTPLARIRMALELVREEPESPGLYLLRMEAECARLDQLLSGILHLSHLGRTETLNQANLIPLVPLIEKIVDDVRLEADRASIRVVFQSPPIAAVVRGDAELLRQAVENVVRNAIRFSPTGGIVELTMHLTSVESNTQLVEDLEIRVNDRGPGISDTNLETVFDPFFRVASDAKNAPEGFGVGLAIARQAVRLHNGHIFAERRAGGGLTVGITLPSEQS